MEKEVPTQTINKKPITILFYAIVVLFLILFSGGVGYFIGVNTVKSEQNQALQQKMNLSHSKNIQNHINIKVTKPTNIKSVSYDEKIAECYPADESSSAKNLIPNNTIQHVVETERRFINLPKDIYPLKDISSQFYTVSGNATVGYISNGGPIGEGLDSTPNCWSTYYTFNGTGEVDLKVKSVIKNTPDYFIRFLVSPTQ